MKRNRSVLVLLIAILLVAAIFAGCSQKTGEGKPVGETSSASGEPDGGKVVVNGPDGEKVVAENKDGNVDIKVSGPKGEATIKGSEEDGKVDIKVSGEDGNLEIKGHKRGGKKIVNVKGPGGRVTLNQDGDKGVVKIEGRDGTTTINSNTDVKESDFDIKFYPESKIVEGAISDVKGPAGKDMKNRNVVLECTGEMSEIKKFYVDQFDNPTVVEEGDEITITSGNPMAGKTRVVSIQKGEEEGKVEVRIMCHDMNM